MFASRNGYCALLSLFNVLSMPTFASNKYRSSKAAANNLGDKIADAYKRRLNSHPFLLFGLPFIGIVVASSFLLTPATALRYERHDRKNRTLTYQETMELGLQGGQEGEGALSYNPRRRKVTAGGTSARDEYYV